MAVFGWVCAGFGAMVGLTLLRAVVLQALWTWFIVETFSAPHLSLVAAIGLSLIVSFLTYQYDASKEQDKKGTAAERFFTAIIAGLLFNAMYFLFGFLVHSFA